MERANIGIIGGGPSGLIALYECRVRHITATLYERESDLGGVWNLQSSNIRAHMSTVMNTTLFLTSFSLDFPLYKFMEDKYRGEAIDFASSSDFNEYLHEFVKHYRLSNMILYNKNIVEINTEQSEERFVIGAVDTITGQRESYIHNYIIIACGRFGNPVVPKDPFLSSDLKINDDKIWHSSQWDPLNVNSPTWTTMEKESKKILIVGSGQSAGEALQDTISRARNDGNYDKLQIYWSPTRNPEKRSVWLLDHYPYRNIKNYIAADEISCRFFSIIPTWIAERQLMKVCRCVSQSSDIGTLLLKNDRICLCHRDTIENALKDGTIQVMKDPITQISKSYPNQVAFSTSKSDPILVDAVVIGSGFTNGEPRINDKHILTDSPFFRFIIPIDKLYNGRVGFICTVQILGSSIPISQMEVKWLLYQWFDERSTLKETLFRLSPQTIEKRSDEKMVPGIVMDKLARDMQVMPKIWRNLFSFSRRHRHLALAYLFGPWSIYQYPTVNESQESQLKRENEILSATEKNFKKRGKSFPMICVISDTIFYLNTFTISYLFYLSWSSFIQSKTSLMKI